MDELVANFEALTIESNMDYNPEKYCYVVSVDIGVKHLAISLCSLTKEYSFVEVIWFELIDITQFNCADNCQFYHDKTFSDYLQHVFFTHHELFNTVANHIIIERQPPQGYVVVEQMIFNQYRNKAVLISPNSVHKYFRWCDDYEKRKIQSEEVALMYIKEASRKYLMDDWVALERKHDVSDSICFTLYFANIKRIEFKEVERKRRYEEESQYRRENNLPCIDVLLEKYRY